MDHDELRQRLRPRSGGPLPKDALIDDAKVRDFPRSYRQGYRRIERNSLQALMASSRSRHHTLAIKVANCSPSQPCGEAVLCWWCKVKTGLAEAEAMNSTFNIAIRRHRISAITIILAVIDLEDHQALKQHIRNFHRYWRVICEGWPGCRWRGRFELDLLTGHPDQELGTYVKKTLKGLGYARQHDSYEDFVLLHTHIVLAHPGVGRRKVVDRLSAAYPLPRQVNVTSLRGEQTMEEALSRFGGYMVKFRPPSFALAGRGSRTCRPRHPHVILDYIQLQRRFSGDDLLIHDAVPRRHQ